MFNGKSIDEITPDDIQGLAGASEGQTFEIKRELPAENPQMRPDAWMRSQTSGKGRTGPEDYAKEGLFREVVAFANTEGGWLVIGIEETGNHPKRAGNPVPLPDCPELAERLQRAADNWLDPPVPGIRFRGIELGGEPVMGVVIARIPRSPLAPHRLATRRFTAYRRVQDEAKPMAMREIQDMAVARRNEAERMTKLIEDARSFYAESPQLPENLDILLGFQVIAAPAHDALALESLSKSPGLFVRDLEVQVNGLPNDLKSIDCSIGGDDAELRPVLRGARHECFKSFRYKSGPTRFLLGIFVEIRENGIISITCQTTHHENGLSMGWILVEVANVLRMISRVRQLGNTDLDYALEICLRCDRYNESGELSIFPYGIRIADVYGHRHPDDVIWRNPLYLPRIPVYGPSTYSGILKLAARDLYNVIGLNPPDLDFQPFH